jgi:hypothetical protein
MEEFAGTMLYNGPTTRPDQAGQTGAAPGGVQGGVAPMNRPIPPKTGNAPAASNPTAPVGYDPQPANNAQTLGGTKLKVGIY